MGKGAMLTWLAARRCPMSRDGKAYRMAAMNYEGPDWATLRRLVDLGCPFAEGLFPVAVLFGGVAIRANLFLPLPL